MALRVSAQICKSLDTMTRSSQFKKLGQHGGGGGAYRNDPMLCCPCCPCCPCAPRDGRPGDSSVGPGSGRAATASPAAVPVLGRPGEATGEYGACCFLVRPGVLMGSSPARTGVSGGVIGNPPGMPAGPLLVMPPWVLAAWRTITETAPTAQGGYCSGGCQGSNAQKKTHKKKGGGRKRLGVWPCNAARPRFGNRPVADKRK